MGKWGSAWQKKNEHAEFYESSIIRYFRNAIHYGRKKQIRDKLQYHPLKTRRHCTSLTTIQWNVNISQLSHGRGQDSETKSNIQSSKKTKLPVTIPNGEGRRRQYNQSIKQIKLPTNPFKSGLCGCGTSLSSVNRGNEEISAGKDRARL